MRGYDIISELLSILIIVLFFVFLSVCGCKGKEEKQTVSSLQSSDLQEKTGLPPSARVQSTGQSPLSPEIISDTFPKITSIKIHPEFPVPGDKIKAKVSTFDKDEDNVMLTFHWSKNGVPLSESSDTLSLSDDFKRGDRVNLTVVPDDGKRIGNPSTIAIVVANTAPLIKPSTDSAKFAGREYTLQIIATDPDGDPLTYFLKSAPPGMTIDPSTGFIKWDVPYEATGKIPFTVSAKDGHGGEAVQDFSLEIKSGQRK